jgi:sugar diacid utilization regulator
MNRYEASTRGRDTALLLHLARYLSFALATEGGDGAVTGIRGLMVGLLQGRSVSADERDRLSKTLLAGDSGLEQANSYRCYVIELDDNTGRRYTPSYLAHLVEARLPGAVVAHFDGRLVVVVAGHGGQGNREHTEGELAALLTEASLRAGRSYEYADFMSLRTHWYQALGALELGRDAEQTELISSFEDHALQYLFRYGCTEMLPEDICAREILRLREHDKLSALSYCDTLRTYLELDRNATRTARGLFVQRNTLLERLDRVKSVSGVDLADPDKRLFYWLSLALLEQAHK